MPSNQDLVMIADRGLSALTEIKGNAVQLASLAQQIREAQSTLARLRAEIAQATPRAAQIEELDSRIKAKRHELAQVELEVSRKSVEHGTIEGKLRDLRKQISGNLQHP